MITLFSILGILFIVYAIGAILYKKIFNQQFKGFPKAAIFVGILFILPSLFIARIPAQNVGVIVTPNGVKQKTLNTGWHIILPWYKIVEMDKTTQVYTCATTTTKVDEKDKNKQFKKESTQSTTIWTPTSDGIKMGFDISASWQIDPNYAWWIYDNVSGQDNTIEGRFYWLEENVIKAKLKSALALTVSKFDPISVYSNKRQNIQDEVLERMKKEIATYHLVLNQIDIREVYYDREYEIAINSKKLEEQRALTLVEVTKQKNELLIQSKIEKDIAIQQAQGEAEALRIKGQSVASNPKIVELEWINKWNGELPTYMLGNGNGLMLNMNK